MSEVKVQLLKRDAAAIVGGLSNTSKMNSKSFGISALECKTGQKLAKVSGSVCESCYACKGAYSWKSVKSAHARRLEALAHPEWIPAMVRLIKDETHFRFFDSGDFQDMDMLHMVVEVCRQCPDTKFWIPTKERKLINRYLRENPEGFPPNMLVRLSAAMIDARPPTTPDGVNTSTVHKNFKPHGKACRAPLQNNECRNCRDCWNPEIKNISYKAH